MLILTRKSDESIYLGNDIMIKILETSKHGTKLGIKAPKEMLILRGELKEQIKSANVQANSSVDDSHIKDFHKLFQK